VPSRKGLSKAISKRLLAAAGCKLGKVSKKKSKSGKRGTVVKQSPKAGSTLAAGAKVKVTVRK
jgi:beta-lactam-binding protein with PASTA domain